MTVTTYDNAAPLNDWMPQRGRHCGEFCWDVACAVCGEFVAIPASIIRGEN